VWSILSLSDVSQKTFDNLGAVKEIILVVYPVYSKDERFNASIDISEGETFIQTLSSMIN